MGQRVRSTHAEEIPTSTKTSQKAPSSASIGVLVVLLILLTGVVLVLISGKLWA